MSKDKKPSKRQPANTREEKLAKALRDNLRRRKSGAVKTATPRKKT